MERHSEDDLGTLAGRKARLRHDIARRRRRRDLAPAERSRASAAITERLLSLEALAAARVVASYAATAEEVDLDRLHDLLVNRGQSVAYPRSDPEGALRFHAVEGLDQLALGRFDIREPAASTPETPGDEIQTILVPGVAFDGFGGRLGRGAGYYDRFLASLGPATTTVGVAFACQVVAEVPVEAHDRRVDFVVTEDMVLRCEHPAGAATGREGS